MLRQGRARSRAGLRDPALHIAAIKLQADGSTQVSDNADAAREAACVPERDTRDRRCDVDGERCDATKEREAAVIGIVLLLCGGGQRDERDKRHDRDQLTLHYRLRCEKEGCSTDRCY